MESENKSKGKTRLTYETYLATRNPSDPKNLPIWVIHDSLRDITEFAFNHLGISHETDISMLRALIAIAKQNKSIMLSYRSLLKAIQAKSPGTSEGAWHGKIQSFLNKMESSGHCLYQRENNFIKEIVLVKGGLHNQGSSLHEEVSLITDILKYYENILNTENYGLPFPHQGKFPIKDEVRSQVTEIDFRELTKEKISKLTIPESSLVQITFTPTSEILIPMIYLPQIFHLAQEKIKNYLQNESRRATLREKIFNFINQNLEMKSQAALKRETFEQALDTFAFQDFSHQDAIIWKNTAQVLYNGTKAKPDLKDISQSAALLFQFLNKEIEKSRKKAEEERKREELQKSMDEDIKHVISQAANDSRPFTEHQIIDFEDAQKETTIGQKYSGELFKEFLQKLVTERIPDAKSPDLLYFEYNNRTYFIHKDKVVNFIRSQVEMIPGNFLNQYRLPWSQDVMNYNRKNRPLFESDEFLAFLTEFIEENYPLFKNTLEQGEVLYRISRNIEGRQKNIAKNWFLDNQPGQLKSLVQITGLSRKYVFNEALHQLGILYWWGPYRRFMAWMRGKKNGPVTVSKKTLEREAAAKRLQHKEELQELPGTVSRKEIKTKSPETERSRSTDEKSKESAKDQKAREEKKQAQQKASREKQDQERKKAESFRDQLLGESSADDMLFSFLKIWNPNLNDQSGTYTKKNVDDAIDAYVQRTMLKKIPLDRDTLEKMIKKLIEKENFQKVHQGKGQKINALQKYAEVYIYINYIQPKYKL